MIDYAENLCEAMKIIFDKQIKQLSFDITIDATVVDASKAENGVYTVSHDGATFIAYSTDTSFKEKDVVMVTVPQGNYDNQKMIIGKQVDKNKEKKPITYQSPFSQITNLSGNLIYGNIEEKGLLANGGIGKSGNEQTAAQIISIKELKSSDSTLSEEYQSNGYTRIGLRADFSTWLNEFNVVSGNYGLILTLKFKNPDITDPEENSTITAIYTFDSSEFFGDIYNFETYYNQEAIFDISDYSNYPIQSITLEAYQKDNFKVSNGSDLSYENEIFDNSFKPSDNIFIKDPFICLGTAIGEFKKDTANIMTTSASIYNNSDNLNNDIKDLKLKWTHQDLKSKDIYVVQNDSIPANYEIRWYKFKLGEKSPDKFMDAHWVRLYCKKEEESDDYYLEENNDQINNINKINVKFQPNRKNQSEQIRVVILRKDENNNELLVVQTPIITFNNNQQILPDIKYIDANALGIQFNDTEKGKYYYYDKTGKKMSSKEKNPEHILKAVFDNNTNLENKGNLTSQTYTSIKWIFPKNNTMIKPIFPNYNSETITIDDTTYSTAYTRKDSNDNYELSFLQNDGENIKSILETMTYKIDDNFSFNKSRNTVYLEVVVNGQTYISSATMFFGTAGTSGSEYTIVVEWSAGIPVFDINKDNETLTGTVKLLDLNFEEVVLNSDATYNYSLKYNLNEGLICQPENNSPNQSNFTISKNNNNIDMNDLYILEIKLTNFGNYNLITNYPIALKNTIKDKNGRELVKINSITGATMVRYASDGTITPDDNNPYSISFQIQENDNFVLANDKYNGFWQIIPAENNNNKNFLPELVDIDNTIEAFILELSKIPYPNNDSKTTLLDVLLYIIPKEDEGYNDNTRLNLLISSINNINNPPFEEGQQKETNNNFKNFLSRIEKRQLNNLFSTLEEKFGKDYFSTLFLSKKINPILSPPSVYFKNTPLYGVQYVYSPDGINNQPLYTQPIYVYQDNYPSTTINQWNGRDLILDKNKGTIIANGFSAGKKEDNNTFTGVMIGDWSKTDSDSSISTTTGIYGFHQGAMSYGFKDDGTAFIGKDGGGRIEFDGENGIIKSANFISPSENRPGSGTLIDLTAGSIELYSSVNNSQNNNTFYSLKLSSIGDENNKPFLQIGRSINQIEIISSTYLSNYSIALEELKQELINDYMYLKNMSQACIKLFDYYYNEHENELNKELWTYSYQEQNSNNIITSGGGKYINPNGNKDDFTLLLEKKVTTNLIGTFYNNIINNRLYNYNTNNDYNTSFGHDFSYNNFSDLLASEYPSGKNNNEERVSAPWSIRKLFFQDTDSARYGKNYWEFLSLTSLGKTTLINYEINHLKSKYLELLTNYYKEPNYNNLKTVNKFIAKYITEFSIFSNSEIRDINNYYLESQEKLIEIKDDNEKYDGKEETQNLQLIKIIFNEDKKLFVSPSGDNYYLAGFIRNDNSIGYQEITDKEAIEAYFNAEKKNQWENGNKETIYYLDKNNHYQIPNYNNTYKSNPFVYHKINDEYIKAGDFWADNTYKRNSSDNGYIQENQSNNAHTYYIKKENEEVYYPIIDYCIEWIEYEDLHNTTNQEIKEVQITSQLDNDESLDEDIFIKNNDSFEKVNNITYKTRNIYWHNIAKENESPYYIEANEFWENNTYNNNYELINKQNFQIYYIKKDDIYYQIRHYYNTNNFNINQYNSNEEALEHLQTPSPILYFEDDKIYYIKNSGGYIQTSECDNNYSYAIASTCMRPLSSIIKEDKNYTFDPDLNYFKYILQEYDNRANQNLIFTPTENQNEYIFKSFIVKSNDAQTSTVQIPLLIGNGKQKVFSPEEYTTVKANTPIDIILQVDPNVAPTGSGWIKSTFDTYITFINENGDEEIEVDNNGQPKTITHQAYTKIKESTSSFGIFNFILNIRNKYNSLYVNTITYKAHTRETKSYKYKMLACVERIVDKILKVNTETKKLLTYIPSVRQADYYDIIKQSYYYGPDDSVYISQAYVTLTKIKENTENKNYIKSICENMKNGISKDTFVFDQTNWENDLIKITKNGGYITSKDYRPTMISGEDKKLRLPTSDQDNSSSNWRQGMKGFIIDLTRNRIVLGNNSKIEGVQTQYYPGQTDVTHRYFSIGTGINFEKDSILDRDKIEKEKDENLEKTFFIAARAGFNTSLNQLPYQFYVRWDGYVFCESLRIHRNFYYGSDFNKVQADKIAGVYDPQGNGNKILRFCDENGNQLSNIHILCY